MNRKPKTCSGFDTIRCNNCARKDPKEKVSLVKSLSADNTCVHYIYKKR